MKPLSLNTILFVLFLLSFTSCLYDTRVEPLTLETTATELEVSQLNNATNPMMVLYLELEKSKTKIEVNRNLATLNFDNHYPRIVRIYTKEKMSNLKNFRAENNLLKMVPEFVLHNGIKRIDVSHNRIYKLPYLGKNKSIKLLDLSYNKMNVTYEDLRKLILPEGAELNLTKTGIPCKYICDYVKRNPHVNVITECECN